MERVDLRLSQRVFQKAEHDSGGEELDAAIADQLSRFCDHVGFSEQRSRELADAMKKVCKTEADIKRLCDALMMNCEYCPVPANVYALVASETRGGEQFQATYRDPSAPIKCAICQDTGFVVEEKDGKRGAVFCKCHPVNKEKSNAAATE